MTRVYDCFKNNPAKKVAWLEEAPDAPHGAFLGLDRSKNNWMIKGAEKWRPFSEVYCPFRDGHSRNVNESTYGTSYNCDSQRTVKDYQGKIVRLPEDFAPMEGARYDTAAYFDGSSYLDCGNYPVLRVTDNFSIEFKLLDFNTAINNNVYGKSHGISSENSYYAYVRANTNTLAIRFSTTGIGNTVAFDTLTEVMKNDVIKVSVENRVVHVYINNVEDGRTSDNSKTLGADVYDSVSNFRVGSGDLVSASSLGIITNIKVTRDINTTPELVLDLPLTNNNYTDQTGNNTIINNGVYDVATDVYNTDTNGNVLSGIVYQPEGQDTNYFSRSTNSDKTRYANTFDVDYANDPVVAVVDDITKPESGSNVLLIDMTKSSSSSCRPFYNMTRLEASGTENKSFYSVWLKAPTGQTGDVVIRMLEYTSYISYDLVCSLTDQWKEFKLSKPTSANNYSLLGVYLGVRALSTHTLDTYYATCPMVINKDTSYIPTKGTKATRLPGALSLGIMAFDTNKLTIAGTVRWDGQIDGSVTYLVTGTGGYIRYAFASNNFDLFENGTLYRTPVNMDTGEFHVAVVVNETLVKTYINGSLAETFNRVNNPSVFPGVMNIGSTTRTSYVKYLKDFIVKRAALSDNEIQQLYQFSK